MKKSILMLSLATTALMFTGCASTGGAVSYGDAQAVETLTTDFGSTDLQMIADKMVTDMLQFPPIVQMTQTRRPVITLERIRNKTQEHIDTESVTDTIQNKLINSGKFRFVDMSSMGAVAEQLKFQKNSGMVNQSTAVRTGGQIGAEFMLNGNLSSIVKQSGGRSDVYYKFTLKLLNMQTGIVEWTGEKEIRKNGKRPTFGL